MPKYPTCYVIAGPNGAGKTTFAMKYTFRLSDVGTFSMPMKSPAVSRRWMPKRHCLGQVGFS